MGSNQSSLLTGLVGGLLSSYIYNVLKNRNTNIANKCHEENLKSFELSNALNQEIIRTLKQDILNISAKINLHDKIIIQEKCNLDHLDNSVRKLCEDNTNDKNNNKIVDIELKQSIYEQEIRELFMRIINNEKRVLSIQRDVLESNKRIVDYITCINNDEEDEEDEDKKDNTNEHNTNNEDKKDNTNEHNTNNDDKKDKDTNITNMLSSIVDVLHQDLQSDINNEILDLHHIDLHDTKIVHDTCTNETLYSNPVMQMAILSSDKLKYLV
jgi:hypothetical protein